MQKQTKLHLGWYQRSEFRGDVQSSNRINNYLFSTLNTDENNKTSFIVTKQDNSNNKINEVNITLKTMCYVS